MILPTASDIIGENLTDVIERIKRDGNEVSRLLSYLMLLERIDEVTKSTQPTKAEALLLYRCLYELGQPYLKEKHGIVDVAKSIQKLVYALAGRFKAQYEAYIDQFGLHLQWCAIMQNLDNENVIKRCKDYRRFLQSDHKTLTELPYMVDMVRCDKAFLTFRLSSDSILHNNLQGKLCILVGHEKQSTQAAEPEAPPASP